MNREILTHLAKRAASIGPMVAHYPDENDKRVTFPPSPYYRFLALLGQELDSILAVELGVCGGGGSLHLAMTSSLAVGVDTALDYEYNIRWIKRNYPNFHFLHEDSVHAAHTIYTRFHPLKIDVLFIDTTHTYEQTMAEYNAYSPYLSDKAVICLDDLFREGMDRVWAEMPDTKVRFDFLHPSQSPTDGGFGVIWR